MSALSTPRTSPRPAPGFRVSIRRSAAALLAPVVALLFASCGGGEKTVGQPPSVPVTVTKAAARDVPLQVTAIGSVEAYSTVQVTALVTGQMMEAAFREGQDVRKGDLLFTIDPRPFEFAVRQAEAALARDRASLENAEDDVTRYTELAEKDYTTKENFEQLKADAEVLRAAVKGDEAALDNARLQLEHCSIRSPINARTGSLQVHPGNIVTANSPTPLVVLNQVSPIYVSFSVTEQNLPEIRAYQAKKALEVEASSSGEPPKSARGVLSFVDNAIDEATGTIMLKATFPNTDRTLWPGQYVNVVLTLAVEKDRLLVPSRCVQTGQSGQYVWVVGGDRKAAMRPVVVERTYDQSAVIRSGLQAGETVVTDGFLRLTAGAEVEISKPAAEKS